MINRFRNLDSSTLIPPVFAGAVAIGACFGWAWGYYENIVEVEAWKKDSWCGTVIYTTPEAGAILGIILGVCLGIVSGLVILLTTDRGRATISILK